MREVFVQVNHQPAILYFQDDQLMSCQVFELIDNQITRISTVLDPKKLKTLSRTLNANSE